jgi:type II secretory pathway component GspD/PulD (secretin)
MKTLILRTLSALCASGLLLTAAAQTAPPAMSDQPGDAPPPPNMADAPSSPDEGAVSGQQAQSAQTGSTPAGNESTVSTAGVQAAASANPGTNASASAASPESTLTAFVPPPQAAGTNSDELRLNFRNAPLDMVLNYLSDAAGFIIVLDAQVRGTVSVISSHPMTKDEAVDLLNSVLNKNGYAAIRDGRTLTIVNKNDAKTRNIPVKTGNNPNAIPANDEIVTQVIPIRFVEARQLVSDLSAFVSPQATVVANEAGNSVVITDTQANIRHLTEIILAIDNSAEAETEIRVFRLKYASPTDVASELSSVFPSANSSGNQSPIQFGGGRGGGRGGGGFGGGANPFAALFGGGTANSSQQRIQKATQVTAVADSRIQAVIITAPKDLMNEIAGMMADLDVPSDRDQGVYVFQMKNGDPQQALQVLQNMFQSSSTSRSGTSSSSQNSALQQRAVNATTTMGTTTTTTGIGGTSSSVGTSGR